MNRFVKNIMTLAFAVTLIIQSQYMIDNVLYTDFDLQGDHYTGVYYEDMYDMLNDACLAEAESKL
jgi:hypothetical protein